MKRIPKMNGSMQEEKYSLVDECVQWYKVEEHSDGGVTITIVVPKRFAALWQMKLNDLTTTEREIAEWENQ